MARKLKEEYQRYALARNRSKILIPMLKKVLQDEIQEFLRSAGMTSPIFDPFEVSNIGRAAIRWEYCGRSLIGADGSLTVGTEGFVIRIDERLKAREFRLRSTAAHELMHTFFYDTERLPPTRLGRDPNARWHFLLEEEICAFLAREFLVPAFSIQQFFSTRTDLTSPSTKNLELLKSKYVASSDVLAYRLISDLKLWDAMFIKFLKKDSTYLAKTRMKSKHVPQFKPLKMPTQMSADSGGKPWTEALFKSITCAEVNRASRQRLEFAGNLVRIESKIDSITPLSVYALVTLEKASREQPFTSPTVIQSKLGES